MIINKTKKKVISQRELVCRNIFSWTSGLMFRRKQNLVMRFPEERKIYLHNFLVFFPLDILIVNEKKEIVEVKRNFPPFSFWNSERKGKYVVELGRTGKYEVGDKIVFIPTF